MFQEISSLKDEGGSTAPGGGIIQPPLLTSHPPRHAHSTHPRSPVSQEMLAGSALSPSFSPALSPLATRSPSISPMVGPLSSGAPLVVGGGPTRGVTRGVQQARYGGGGPASSIHSGYSDPADKELRI